MLNTKSFILEHWHQIEQYTFTEDNTILLNIVNRFSNTAIISSAYTGTILDGFNWNIKNEKGLFYKKICVYRKHKGYKNNAALYRKAEVSAQTFSKIKHMDDDVLYVPEKSTIICLILALNLSVTEANELLQICGYTLSNEEITDKVIAYCLETKRYDIKEIDEAIEEKLGKRYLIPRYEGYDTEENRDNANDTKKSSRKYVSNTKSVNKPKQKKEKVHTLTR